MDIKLFLDKFADIVEEEADSVSLSTQLESLDAWDSLARITFLVFASDECKKRLDGNLVKEAETVSDLYKLIQ